MRRLHAVTLPDLLILKTLAANDQSSRERMLMANLSQYLEYLYCKLSSRGNDEGTQAIIRSPLCSMQLFEQRYEESESFP